MTTIGFYFRELDKDDVNALRTRLNALAATFGYTAERGPTAGDGNLAAMLMAIDCGELALVLLPDIQYRPAIDALDKISAKIGYGDNWAETIANALRAALERQAETE
jgi:hypothetical protein